MKFSPIRRAQLIAPFGVGAMFTAPDGTGMITCGLDGWFDSSNASLDEDEFIVKEWRLETQLRVNHFRLPPDHRRRTRQGEQTPNLFLDIPALVFPLWHFCPSTSCRALVERAPHHGTRQRCPECERRLQGAGRKAPFLNQVSFVAMCEGGHLQDFPWREWVHRDPHTTCRRQLRLKSTGGATLASQMVHCECGVAPRNLSRVTDAFETDAGVDTFLSSNMAQGDRFVCRGRRPWVDDRGGEGCGLPMRGTLRASTSAYFSHIASSIFLPGGESGLPEGLLSVLESPFFSPKLRMLQQLGEISVEKVRRLDRPQLLTRFSDSDIELALSEIFGESDEEGDEGSLALDHSKLRRPEFGVLRESNASDDLIIRPMNVAEYGETLSPFFSKVNLVDRLRETRVMYGFSRIEPDPSKPLTDLKSQLWNEEPNFDESWLPAYVVRGEGIFIEFDEERLARWESRPDVQARVERLKKLPDRLTVNPELADEKSVARFVLLHTTAHILLNQLVFECGYSSASLRERIFSSSGEKPMGAIMIYTAAGDSEGTMGGLVRMGKPGKLELAFAAALERAHWCSADPVCMELGELGQGPKSMNLAACHACGLLPETSCESFNVFLDRGLVTGTADNPGLGFFAS